MENREVSYWLVNRLRTITGLLLPAALYLLKFVYKAPPLVGLNMSAFDPPYTRNPMPATRTQRPAFILLMALGGPQLVTPPSFLKSFETVGTLAPGLGFAGLETIGGI